MISREDQTWTNVVNNGGTAETQTTLFEIAISLGRIADMLAEMNGYQVEYGERPRAEEAQTKEDEDLGMTVDAEPKWIPCSERLPEKDGYYLTTTMYYQVYRDYWNVDNWDRTELVLAWMPLPKPYEVKK